MKKSLKQVSENSMGHKNPIFFVTIASILIILYFTGTSYISKPIFTMSPSSLVIHIAAAHSKLGADDVAKIKVTVSNPTSQPITVLNWGSPFDPKAAVAGIFKAVEVGDPEEKIIEGPTIMFRRVTPPSRTDLVEIPSGGEVTVEVELPEFPFEAGKSYRLKIEGRWMSAWPVEKDNLTEDMLEGFGTEEEMTGNFHSNKVTISKA